MASEIIKQINPNAELICDEQRIRPEKSEVNRLLGSNEKIQKLTDWKPRYSLERGLGETIEWIRKNMKCYKPDIYNV